jgi:SAM-dependent methyltransferase
VARIALEVSEQKMRGFVVHGVDRADIPDHKPADSEGATGFRLQGGIDLAWLPFADGDFNCVVSQFGLEYSSHHSAIPEALRVLRPGGFGLFLMHNAYGTIFAACTARLRAYRHVFPDDAVFRSGELTFRGFANDEQTPAPEAVVRFQSDVAAAVQRFSEAGDGSNTGEALAFLADLARAPHLYDPEDALHRLKFVEDDLSAWRGRQEAMVDVALDSAGVSRICDTLTAAGADAAVPEPFRLPSGKLLAWKVAFRKG